MLTAPELQWEATIELRELGDAVVCDLPDKVVSWLSDHGVVTAVPVRSGGWEIAAARKIGVVRVGRVTVWIKPKLDVPRIVWMLGWAAKPGWLPSDPVSMAPTSELVPALATAFANQGARALQRGLLHGYQAVEDELTVLRGRLRTADQLRRRYGMALPLAVRYGDHRADIAENQLLRAAATLLLRLPGVGVEARNRLRALRGLLGSVSDLVPGRPLPSWHRTRLNARYHNALALAEVVLAGDAFEHDRGQLPVDGFLVDMYQLYEDFVTSTLSVELGQIAGRCVTQHRYTLDEQEAIDIRPDLLWLIENTPAAVIDAKYKAEKMSGFPQVDLYQAAAYATAYGLDRAYLVYAKGNESGATWTVRNSGVHITAHTLDLGAPPTEILSQIGGVASQIACHSDFVARKFVVGTGRANWTNPSTF